MRLHYFIKWIHTIRFFNITIIYPIIPKPTLIVLYYKKSSIPQNQNHRVIEIITTTSIEPKRTDTWQEIQCRCKSYFLCIVNVLFYANFLSLVVFSAPRFTPPRRVLSTHISWLCLFIYTPPHITASVNVPFLASKL